MNCNCLLGHLKDYDYIPLRRNTIVDELKFHSKCNNCMVDEGFNKDRISPRDYLDKRCNLAEMFNYCPYCGEKIDWEKIKQEVK